jgi:hypothetical protein
VPYIIYTSTHGANFLIYNELFAIGKSIMSLVLCEFVVSMNVVFRKFISWPIGIEMIVVMEDFKQFCGLPIILEAIDDNRILIFNPFTLYLEYLFLL